MKKLFILTVLLILKTASAQRPGQESNILLLPQMFPLNQLSGYRYTSLVGTSSNLISLNPAAINSFNRLSAGFTYQFQSNLEDAWIAGIGSKWLNNNIPQSAGLVVPLGDFHIAAGMNQLYRSALDFGFIEITTITQPDGTGEVFTPEIKTRINEYSLAGSYLFRNVFDAENSLAAGVRISYNHIREHQGIYRVGFDEEFYALSFSAGAIYNIDSQTSSLTIGAAYESGFNDKTSTQFSGSGLLIPDSVGSDQRYKIAAADFVIRCQTPPKVNAGILLDFKNNLLISGNLNYIFWQSVQSNSNNELQVSSSLIYNASGFFTVSVGFLITPKTYSDELDNYFDIDYKMSALYFTLGTQINYYNFYTDISLADSHLGGGEWRKHTIGKFTLGYNF